MAAADKKKNSIVGTIIFVVFAAALIVGIYLSITRNRDKTSAESDAKTTEANLLISKDLSKDYPATVREVLRLYCRITKCLYNDDLSDGQLVSLVDQLRALYSDELLENNERNDMIAYVRGDISSYKSATRSIQSYSIDESGQISYSEDRRQAAINMYFTIKNEKEKSFVRAAEEFILELDEGEKWKIVGWRLAEE